MEHYVGIDVSLQLSSLCVLDSAGKVIREAKVASEPEALVAFLRALELPIARIGLEAGPLSQWLYDGLHKAGFEAVLLETRHVKAALSAMAVKTDRRDARGIAQLLRKQGDDRALLALVGDDASEARFRREAPQAALLHLATHGIEAGNPLTDPIRLRCHH